jgi:hypothetical protein
MLWLWEIFSTLGPYARLTSALVPFVTAMCVRLVFGRSRVVAWMISLSTMWFLVNVLLAPYSPGMREDFRALESMLR